MKSRIGLWLLVLVLALSACTDDNTLDSDIDESLLVTQALSNQQGETAAVVEIIDGDTIDVRLDGEVLRVRYIGINTPERDESCYQEATNANVALVDGKTVRLVRDVSETDRFGRLLRYVYVGNLFVNATLVRQGYAEAVSYPPDVLHHEMFVGLEHEAATANRACHRAGIFDDGSSTR